MIDCEHLEAETIAGAALKLAQLSSVDGAVPAVIFDCRNMPAVGSPAPSYKLLSKVGWLRTIPYALGWAEGTEVIQAVRLYLAMSSTALGAISALNWPNGDSGDKCENTEVAAACMLGNAPSIKKPRYAILATGYARRQGQRKEAVLAATAEVLNNAMAVQPRWICGSQSAIRILSTIQTDMVRLDNIEADVHYGCVDPLMGLVASSAATGPGIIVSGEADCVGALLVLREGI